LTHYVKKKEKQMLLVPDISHYEPNVQFHDIKASGVPCVITKATQGTSYTDPTFLDFLARGRSVGLIMGAYAFLNPGGGAAQADYLLEVGHLTSGDLQPIVDAEKLGLTKETTFAALEELTRRGYAPILYASLSFFGDVLGNPTDYPLWLAAYRAVLPDLPGSVALFAWQYTDRGHCPGVATTCDCSHFYGSLDDLKSYCI
jgi:GH25 family lysozyme M1 (1,4-beta-N-acetylmuramidase)